MSLCAGRSIVLTGFSGCGKTSAGTILAETLGRAFFDMDGDIEDTLGMSVRRIFAELGEPVFRAAEEDSARKAAHLGSDVVIACGGGALENPEIARILKRNGVFVYLISSPCKVYENLSGDHSRPLLDAPDKCAAIAVLMAKRTPLYEKYSDATADAGGASPTDTAAAIINALTLLNIT